MHTIYLTPDQVPAHLRNGYSGKRFKAIVSDSVTIPSDADLWSGGSRDRYQVVELSSGKVSAPAHYNKAPWDVRADNTIALAAGYAVVRHSMFCGKDMGLTFYIHPSDTVALLPAPSAELSAVEKIVLNATASYKASYNGRDRYQMAQDDQRWSKNPVTFDRAAWDSAKASLVTKGLLNKAGAITVAGRNAR